MASIDNSRNYNRQEKTREEKRHQSTERELREERKRQRKQEKRRKAAERAAKKPPKYKNINITDCTWVDRGPLRVPKSDGLCVLRSSSSFSNLDATPWSDVGVGWYSVMYELNRERYPINGQSRRIPTKAQKSDGMGKKVAHTSPSEW